MIKSYHQMNQIDPDDRITSRRRRTAFVILVWWAAAKPIEFVLGKALRCDVRSVGPLLRISFSNRPKVTFCAFPQTERAESRIRNNCCPLFRFVLFSACVASTAAKKTFLPVAKSGRSLKKKKACFSSLANQ